MADETMPTPDRAAAEAFWLRFLERSGESGDFSDLTCFGDSPPMADELLELIVEGPKRATAGALADYEAEGLPLPRVGDRWIACDGRGTPRAVLRTTEAFVAPLSSVDEQFAWDEGEGDRTRADWLRGHTAYFTRRFDELGLAFHADIDVCFERFEVVYVETAAGN